MHKVIVEQNKLTLHDSGGLLEQITLEEISDENFEALKALEETHKKIKCVPFPKFINQLEKELRAKGLNAHQVGEYWRLKLEARKQGLASGVM